jgi:BPG-independent PGAM N-terminus (iPGM_N)
MRKRGWQKTRLTDSGISSRALRGCPPPHHHHLGFVVAVAAAARAVVSAYGRGVNKYAQELLDFMDKLQYGKVATIVGQYYAMDRGKRWERVETAVKGLVNGDGEKVDDAVKAVEKRYEQDETDEFLKRIILGGEASRVKGECDLSAKRCFEDTHADAWCRERHFILLQLSVGPYAGDC